MKRQNAFRAMAAATAIVFAAIFANVARAQQQGDLSIFDLKGKVKTCKWTNDMNRFIPYDKDDEKGHATTYTFSGKGSIVKIGDAKAIGEGGGTYYMSAQRDAKGRMTEGVLNGTSKYFPGYGMNSWTYSAKGNVETNTYEEDCTNVTTTYKYDQKGQIQQATIKYVFDFDPDDYEDADFVQKLKDHTVTISYTYLASDAKGNWTKRTAKASDGNSWSETRVITYYQ